MIKQLTFKPLKEELRVVGMILCYPLINPMPDKNLNLTDPNNPETKLMKEFLYQTESPNQEQKDKENLTKQVTSDTLPSSIWHSIDDPIVNCEYHLYEHSGHGLGLANRIYARNENEVAPDIAQWTINADRWMHR